MVAEVNGAPVVRSGELSSLIGMAAPGDKVSLKVWRERAWRTIDVKLGGVPEADKEVAEAGDEAAGPRLGLALRPMSKADMQRERVEQGLVVESVEGPAARAGIEPGDVLLAINGKPVQSMEQVRSALQGKPKRVALLVQRDGEQIFVPVNLG